MKTGNAISPEVGPSAVSPSPASPHIAPVRRSSVEPQLVTGGPVSLATMLTITPLVGSRSDAAEVYNAVQIQDQLISGNVPGDSEHLPLSSSHLLIRIQSGTGIAFLSFLSVRLDLLLWCLICGNLYLQCAEFEQNFWYACASFSAPVTTSST